MESTEPVLSVVVSTHSRADLLAECLSSLAQALEALGEPAEVVVVDDGGQEGLEGLITERLSSASLVRTSGNAGFAAAVAAGMRAVRGEWIALLNDDVTVEPPALAALLAAGRSAPDIGSVAAQMRFATSPGTINSAGIEVDRLGMPCDRLLGEPVEASETEPVEVFGASGGAALYRRAALEAIDGFDESFFAYLDDADVAWRARMCGWRCLYAPGAVVYHLHSSSFGHRSSLKHFLVGRNRVRLVAKNATARHLLRYGAAMAAYDLAYIAYAAVRQRTLAPLRGRLRGLREWRTYRRAGSPYRRPLPLPPRKGLRAALRRNRAWPDSASGKR